MAAGLKQVFVSGLTEHTTAAKDQLGDLRREGNKVYKYVKKVASTASVDPVVGSVCYYKAAGYDANEVVADQSDGVCAAGLAMSAPALSEYFWIQIRGTGVCTTDAAAGAAGNAMTHVGANDKGLDVSALVTDPIVAVLLTTTTGAQIIICLFPE